MQIDRFSLHIPLSSTMITSSLDGADHYAFDKVLLQERIENQRRQTGYDDDTVFNQLRNSHLRGIGLHVHHHAGVHLILNENVAAA